MQRGKVYKLWTLLTLAWGVGLADPVRAEGPLFPYFGPSDWQTSVSFIDSALPRTQFRVRYDDAQNLDRPNRAEFFWPAPGVNGRPRPERNVDYQELQSYLEIACGDRISIFFEAPVRFVNPVVNDSTSGAGDLNAGAKLALWQCAEGVVTAQVRTYIPTGIGERGLGTDHVTIEPALLINRRLHDWVTFEGEVRYGIPLGGSEFFRGDIFRYGAGLVLGQQSHCGPWITPVAEFVGWVPMGGRSLYLSPANNLATDFTRNQPILNGLFGARAGLGQDFDLYGGYGVSLTGNHWYEEIWRLELRVKF